MVTTFFMLPTIALIMFDDAFYSDGSLSVVRHSPSNQLVLLSLDIVE